VVDDFFQAYPMIPLSCRSNLAAWYLEETFCIRNAPFVLGEGRVHGIGGKKNTDFAIKLSAILS
jgi:hypothetical protein